MKNIMNVCNNIKDFEELVKNSKYKIHYNGSIFIPIFDQNGSVSTYIEVTDYNDKVDILPHNVELSENLVPKSLSYNIKTNKYECNRANSYSIDEIVSKKCPNISIGDIIRVFGYEFRVISTDDIIEAIMSCHIDMCCNIKNIENKKSEFEEYIVKNVPNTQSGWSGDFFVKIPSVDLANYEYFSNKDNFIYRDIYGNPHEWWIRCDPYKAPRVDKNGNFNIGYKDDCSDIDICTCAFRPILVFNMEDKI